MLACVCVLVVGQKYTLNSYNNLSNEKQREDNVNDNFGISSNVSRQLLVGGFVASIGKLSLFALAHLCVIFIIFVLGLHKKSR